MKHLVDQGGLWDRWRRATQPVLEHQCVHLYRWCQRALADLVDQGGLCCRDGQENLANLVCPEDRCCLWHRGSLWGRENPGGREGQQDLQVLLHRGVHWSRERHVRQLHPGVLFCRESLWRQECREYRAYQQRR